jgi:uncharacterized lipoprotein YajG
MPNGIHWSKQVKTTIARKLARGTTPSDIKQSFGKMLDDIVEKMVGDTATADMLRKQARTIARLQAKLDELGRGK